MVCTSSGGGRHDCHGYWNSGYGNWHPYGSRGCEHVNGNKPQEARIRICQYRSINHWNSLYSGLALEGKLDRNWRVPDHLQVRDLRCSDHQRAYVRGGGASTASPTDVEPSTLVNSVGICNGSADTNFAICAAGASAQSEISLGTNFPANTTSTDVYELVLSAPPNGSSINYKVTRLNTGNVATGTITSSSQLPATTTFLTTQLWRSNSGIATAVAIDLVGLYGQTVYYGCDTSKNSVKSQAQMPGSAARRRRMPQRTGCASARSSSTSSGISVTGLVYRHDAI